MKRASGEQAGPKLVSPESAGSDAIGGYRPVDTHHLIFYEPRSIGRSRVRARRRRSHTPTAQRRRRKTHHKAIPSIRIEIAGATYTDATGHDSGRDCASGCESLLQGVGVYGCSVRGEGRAPSRGGALEASVTSSLSLPEV